jgi:hypothetical protein
MRIGSREGVLKHTSVTAEAMETQAKTAVGKLLEK